MKTIERYVFGSFLSSFLLAFLVLSFVLTIGLMVQIVTYILQGVPFDLVGHFALVSFPETMQWTMPLALLVSSVLVFSRMSADSEIAAMRSCGVNLVSVMKWPVAFSLLCVAFGFFVNNEVVPRGHEVRRSLKTKVSVDTGIDLLEPGHVIDDFPKMKLYFGAKDGWTHVVDDMFTLRQQTGKKYSDLPYFLMGHSMGSFLARTYLIRYPGTVKGAVIMGTGQQPGYMVAGGKLAARIIGKKSGFDQFNATVDGLAFGAYNKPFEPKRTNLRRRRDGGAVPRYARRHRLHRQAVQRGEDGQEHADPLHFRGNGPRGRPRQGREKGIRELSQGGRQGRVDQALPRAAA